MEFCVCNFFPYAFTLWQIVYRNQSISIWELLLFTNRGKLFNVCMNTSIFDGESDLAFQFINIYSRKPLYTSPLGTQLILRPTTYNMPNSAYLHFNGEHFSNLNRRKQVNIDKFQQPAFNKFKLILSCINVRIERNLCFGFTFSTLFRSDMRLTRP